MTYKKFDTMFKSGAKHFFCSYDKKFCDGELMATENILIKPVHRIMDIVYKLDDEYHNFEFQSGKLKEKDLRRFNLYHSMLIDEYQTEKLKTTIIYTEKIDKKTIDKIEKSCFDLNIISLKEFNGDKILNNIEHKIKNNKRITQKDECNLAFLPLYQTKKDPKELLYKVCSLTNQIKQIPQENLDYIKVTQLMIVDILITDTEKKERYLEEIQMKSQAIDILIEKGRQEGIKEGRQEGLIEGIEAGKQAGIKEGSRNTKFNLAKNMLKADISINNIIKITDLSKEEIENLK